MKETPDNGRQARLRAVARYFERMLITYLFAFTTPLLTANLGSYLLGWHTIDPVSENLDAHHHIYYSFWFVGLLMLYGYFIESSRALGRCRLHRFLIRYTSITLLVKLVDYWYDLSVIRYPLFAVLFALGVFFTLCEIRAFIRARKEHRPMFTGCDRR